MVDQRGPLEYDLFVAALVFGDRAPLQNAISALFGMMLTGPIGSKNIKDIGRRGGIKGKYGGFRAVGLFCQKAHKVMNKMLAAILLFDWFALLPPGQILNIEVDNNVKSVMHIWNATNLWLRRGLYNTRPFPAIWYVDIPDLTLEKMEEAYIELEPEKKKLKTEPPEKKAPKEETNSGETNREESTSDERNSDENKNEKSTEETSTDASKNREHERR
jgi:hypothetical protein